MATAQSTVFASLPISDENPTEPIVPIKWFKIVMTVVELKNPYLDGKQTDTPMLVTRQIAEMMFQNTITSYEEMAGGHPFQKIGEWKYKGVFNGQKVTLELVG